MNKDVLFKGNLKEGIYKLIKTTNGWVLEGEDIAYAGFYITERPQGEWTDIYQLSTDGRMTRMSAQCKNCGEKTIFWNKTPNFCPECGARMKGVNND